MGSIGIWQILLVLVIVVILFGAGKLPRVMKDLGQGVKSFKKGLQEEEKQQVSENQAAPSASGDSRDRSETKS